MDKFKNKYRIQSHRKPHWDYSADALYFLTINTQHRECNLGKIIDNEMILSDFGKIVETEWYKSFEIRNELILHEFIIMPNHLHSIVEIRSQNTNTQETDTRDMNTGTRVVETHGRASLPIGNDSPIVTNSSIVTNSPTVTNSSIESNSSTELETPTVTDKSINSELLSIKRNPPIRLPKSISSFVAGFKSAINTKIDDYIDEQKLSIPKYNRKNHFFQPNYHDHIIRNNFEYQNISNYIINNPANWNNDTLNE